MYWDERYPNRDLLNALAELWEIDLNPADADNGRAYYARHRRPARPCIDGCGTMLLGFSKRCIRCRIAYRKKVA